jgi:hypothetical protein
MAKNNSDKSSNFSGWQGRSGLDPIDTSRINASVDAIFLKRLFTLRLRTRNIFSLIAMLIFGVVATSLMLFAFYGFLSMPLYRELKLSDYLLFALWYSMLGFILLVGLALLLNFAINIGIMVGIIKSPKIRNYKEAKKKLPKRRKDYR